MAAPGVIQGEIPLLNRGRNSWENLERQEDEQPRLVTPHPPITVAPEMLGETGFVVKTSKVTSEFFSQVDSK